MKQNVKMKIGTKIAVHCAVAAVGFLLAVSSVAVFSVIDTPGRFNDSERINFTLFRDVSLTVTSVLLGLNIISRIGCEMSKRPSDFSKKIASVAPAVSCAAVLFSCLFFTYLTSGSGTSTEPFILLFGIGESLLFAIPGAIRLLFHKNKERTCK